MSCKPYEIKTCTEIREILNRRASGEQELLDAILEVDVASLYYHTHSYYLQEKYYHDRHPNDFATWVAIHAHDRVLGEKLGVLDPFAYRSPEELRQDIIAIMDDHLNRNPARYRYTTGEPFDFVRSHVIEAPLNRHTWTLAEFRDAVQEVEVGALYNHLCEARMRKTPGFDDFSYWIAAKDGLQRPELAGQVERVVRLGLNLEGMRARIVGLCDEELRRKRS